mgnify:CR=1 FL=1
MANVKTIGILTSGGDAPGMNAAVNGETFDEFQKASGALQQGGTTSVFLHVLTGKIYGPAPMYGELPYQYYKSKYGYDLGQQRIWIKNNIKYMTPNNIPSIGELFNGIR